MFWNVWDKLQAWNYRHACNNVDCWDSKQTTGIGADTKISISTDTDTHRYWQVSADTRYQYRSNPTFHTDMTRVVLTGKLRSCCLSLGFVYFVPFLPGFRLFAVLTCYVIKLCCLLTHYLANTLVFSTQLGPEMTAKCVVCSLCLWIFCLYLVYLSSVIRIIFDTGNLPHLSDFYPPFGLFKDSVPILRFLMFTIF